MKKKHAQYWLSRIIKNKIQEGKDVQTAKRLLIKKLSSSKAQSSIVVKKINSNEVHK